MKEEEAMIEEFWTYPPCQIYLPWKVFEADLGNTCMMLMEFQSRKSATMMDNL